MKVCVNQHSLIMWNKNLLQEIIWHVHSNNLKCTYTLNCSQLLRMHLENNSAEQSIRLYTAIL